jgi:hypothetical protein
MALAVVVCAVWASQAAMAAPPALNSVFDGKTLDGWNQVPAGTFEINATEGAIETTGSARGFLYTTQTYSAYRILYSVYQNLYLHEPSVLFFGTSDTADAMDGLQFELPTNISWDYQQTGKYANTFLPVTSYNNGPEDKGEQIKTWYRCEMLVNTANASADSACSFEDEPTTASHIMYFKNSAVPVEDIPTSFALQAHQTGVSDEYRNILIENNPPLNELVLLALPGPSALTATTSSSQINLSWKINSTSQTGFEVFHSTDNQTWTLVDTTTADATTYSDTSLASNTTYYYRVAAVMSNAISDYATASATSGPATCSPTPIVPFIQIGNGPPVEESSATVPYGTLVSFSPQPLTGGWSWVGPNGFTSTAREILDIEFPVGTTVYTATFTNSCGAKSSQPFTITVGPTTDLIPNGTYIVTSVHSGLAIDDPDFSKTDGQDMQIYAVNDGVNQQWKVNNVSANVITLTNVSSGQLLAVAGGSAAPEARVDQYPANGDAYEEWNVIFVGSGIFELTNANSGLALDVAGGGAASGTAIDQYAYGGATWQQWKFQAP